MDRVPLERGGGNDGLACCIHAEFGLAEEEMEPLVEGKAKLRIALLGR